MLIVCSEVRHKVPLSDSLLVDEKAQGHHNTWSRDINRIVKLRLTSCPDGLFMARKATSELS